ncbi:hypothetical protein EPH95_02860 [Salicibibacter halophilus]|uniref:HNH nuclease domain-containing protein n=1 Tax=Salicibibacter halophilus TaxID=2502791 RepID=A0A514LEG1_9BACI|nr:NUMOD4 domain-containing protein [Salicibibacter halophilus]QDI90242.1 hypothetical protein EPH95_02860 [Salicibibacter halophilus]
MKETIWRDIDGYEKYYQVSNTGEVRSKDREVYNGRGFRFSKGRILNKSKTTTGYLKVDLRVNGRRKSVKVHRLVAKAFIENPGNKPNVNHIDGNPINNNADNLEWCTQKENMSHAHETGLVNSNVSKYANEIINEYKSDSDTNIRTLSKKYKCAHVSIRKLLSKNNIEIKGISEIKDTYEINKKELSSLFETDMKNKDIANHFNTNRRLIAVYRHKHKRGELIK